MNKIIGLAFVLMIATACKSSLEQKQAACKTMFAAYCEKAEECTGQPAKECFQRATDEGICTYEIASSVEDIRACEIDLLSATCDSPPESCMTLE